MANTYNFFFDTTYRILKDTKGDLLEDLHHVLFLPFFFLASYVVLLSATSIVSIIVQRKI